MRNPSLLEFFFFKQKTAYEIVAVTGVQTCALPILAVSIRRHIVRRFEIVKRHVSSRGYGSLHTPAVQWPVGDTDARRRQATQSIGIRMKQYPVRSEERRVGKERRPPLRAYQ